MARNTTPDRPASADEADGRKASDGRPVGDRENNSGRGDGLTAKLDNTVATAPDHATLSQIASVAWVSYETRTDPADIWPEVLAETGCPKCGREPQPSADGELVCPACDLALVGGCR